MQEVAVLALTLLPFEELPAVLGGSEVCAQSVPIHCESINCLNGNMRFLRLLEGQVRAVDRHALVAMKLRLHGCLADSDALQFSILSKEFRRLQDLFLCHIGRKADHVHHIPLDNPNLRQIPAARSALEFLSMSSTHVSFLLLSGLVVLLVHTLFLFCLFFSKTLGTTCIIPKLGLHIVLSACRAFAIHLLHNVVDTEQADLVIARTGKKRDVRLIQGLHAKWT